MIKIIIKILKIKKKKKNNKLELFNKNKKYLLLNLIINQDCYCFE